MKKTIKRDEEHPDFVSTFLDTALKLAGMENEINNKDSYVVEFKIDGVDCPFIEVIHELEKDATTHINEEAKKLSKEQLESSSEAFNEMLVQMEETFDRFVRNVTEDEND